VNGNWLQDLLHWYWITPWQLIAIDVIIIGIGVGMIGFGRIGRRR
jgi:hypothetical protein